MAFQPYSVFDARLPKLKPGFFLEIAGKFYQIMVVRNNRQLVAMRAGTPIGAGAHAEPGYVLNSSSNAQYQALHGGLDQERVVQIQYVSLTVAAADGVIPPTIPWILLRWGTEPLFSKVRPLYIDANAASLTNPLQLDRWSYDKEMRLSIIKAAGNQDMWLEIIEYTVTLWKKTSPKRYLKILANGQAVFVEAG